MDDFGTAPTAQSAAELIKDSDTANFQADVLEVSKQVPVLVDFWAPWCGPCKQLTPALENVVGEAGGSLRLVKINVDENQALSGQMGVQSIPAVFAFFNGQPIDGFMGALPESELKKFVAALMEKVAAAGGPTGAGAEDEQLNQALQMAQQALENGDFDQAGQIYQLILQQIPDHLVAMLGITSVLIAQDRLDDAKGLLDQVPEDKREEEAYQVVAKTLELAQQAQSLGDSSELEAKVAQNPDDHQAHIDLAVQLNAAGQKEKAAETLMASFKRDREWNDGATRKQLLEFFEVWGATDPATIRGRRLLSSVLFS